MHRCNACARRLSGSRSRPVHPAGAKSFHWTSVEGNFLRPPEDGPVRHQAVGWRKFYLREYWRKANVNVLWQYRQRRFAPAKQNPSLSQPGWESDQHGVAAQYQLATMRL